MSIRPFPFPLLLLPLRHEGAALADYIGLFRPVAGPVAGPIAGPIADPIGTFVLPFAELGRESSQHVEQ